MTDSPFRRIILPALLAASAGFAALTWPLASEQRGRVSDGLPESVRYWVDSALVSYQHKEVSIRYIGFAILSSVSIGLGTAEAMRARQVQAKRQPRVAAMPPSRMAATLATQSALPEVLQTPALEWSVAEDSVTTPAAAPPQFSGEPANRAEMGLLSAPTAECPLYHLQLSQRERCLALMLDGEFYRYYRNRPSEERARSLVQHLRRRGQAAVTTWDDSGYVVWVHHPAATPATVWPEALGVSAR